jgi:soluble lytic murein transglycosylase
MCGTLALGAFAANPGPRISSPKHPLLKKCFDRVDDLEPTQFFSKNLKWKLKCDIESLREDIRSDRKLGFMPPHVKLLLASEIYREFLKFRALYFTEVVDQSKYSKEDAFFWDPILDQKVSTDVEPKLGPLETPIEAFKAASASWIDDFAKLLEPLMKGLGRSVGLAEFEGRIFSEEAAFLWIQILASAGRFDEIKVELEGRLAFLLNENRFREDTLKIIFENAEAHPSNSEVLKPILMRSLAFLPSLSPKRLESFHLDLWGRYLRLKGSPSQRLERDELLAQLRNLWILFPLREHKVFIRKLAIDLGVSSSFVGPSVRQMKIAELLLHADRQIRLLEGNAALTTLSQVLRLPSQQYSKDELWEALELHVRLMRIMDKRHMISALLTQYIQKGHFLDIPSKSEDRPSFFKRLYAIGRWQWSYASPQTALATFDRVISLNRAWGTDFELASSYYIRARIMEQGGDRKIARLYFEEAIQELKDRSLKNSDFLQDLLWRRFFNEFDLASDHGNYKVLDKLIEELKSFTSMDEDGERWLFWRAMVHLVSGEKDKAIEAFRSSYKKAPLSFFSVMSGLELLKLDARPSDWILPDASKYWISNETWSESSYSDFFDKDSLKPSTMNELPWAQVYGLGAIGFFDQVSRYLPDLEKRVYANLGDRSHTNNFRRRVLKRAAWLRLAVGDQLGSLRMGELARITFQGDLDAEDLAYLYPLPFKSLIVEAASKEKLDPWHAISLIRQESAFNPRARSIANALGLMQMIPPVAIEDAKKLGIQNFQPEMLLEPEMAVRVGTYHLSQLFIHFESSLIASTAGYNAGRPPVYTWLKHYSHPIPYVFVDRISFSETRKYVRSILRNYVNYSRIYNKAELNPETLLKMPVLMPGEVIATSSGLVPE